MTKAKRQKLVRRHLERAIYHAEKLVDKTRKANSQRGVRIGLSAMHMRQARTEFRVAR